MNRLGEIIKERRTAKGLTLRQLSGVSGVSAAHLGRIEEGERFPSAGILGKLVEPLGFGEVELFKLAGYLSRDDTDERIDRFKREIRIEIIRALKALFSKIDSL